MIPKIAIGCPCRNRAWILPDYLKALESINYPNKQYIFVENDSTDDTLDILQEFKFKHESTQLDMLRHTADVPGEGRNEYSQNEYKNLCEIRNYFIERFLVMTDADFLFSVDSDIIVPPDILDEDIHGLWALSCKGNEIMGAAISNIPNTEIDGHTPTNFMVKRGDSFIHPPTYPLSELFRVAMVGAVSLIPRKILQQMYDTNKGKVYKPHHQGEDLGFALNVPEGTKFYVNMDCRPEHRMVKP